MDQSGRCINSIIPDSSTGEIWRKWPLSHAELCNCKWWCFLLLFFHWLHLMLCKFKLLLVTVILPQCKMKKITLPMMKWLCFVFHFVGLLHDLKKKKITWRRICIASLSMYKNIFIDIVSDKITVFMKITCMYTSIYFIQWNPWWETNPSFKMTFSENLPSYFHVNELLTAIPLLRQLFKNFPCYFHVNELLTNGHLSFETTFSKKLPFLFPCKWIAD